MFKVCFLNFSQAEKGWGMGVDVTIWAQLVIRLITYSQINLNRLDSHRSVYSC